MLHIWIRRIAFVCLGTSLLLLYACFSLAFAGGWVGKYAHVIELVAFFTILSASISGAVVLYLHKGFLFNGASRTRRDVTPGSPPRVLSSVEGFSETVTYSNFNGRVVSEARSGTNLDYVRDTLGSTAALADATQALSDTWQYWPYGEVVSHVGSSNTPLTWVGTLGYYQDLLGLMYYIRARIERPDLARWLTVDPLWPDEPSYSYALQAPIYTIDPSGKLAAVGTPCTDLLRPGDLDENARDLINCLSKATDRASIQKCLDKFGKGLDDKAKDALRAFIACTIASRLARGNCVPLCPGCDPCKSGLEAPDNQWCCYEKFLNCLMKCYGKGGIDLGLCITKCNYSKNGFIDCGFANAL